MTGHLCVSASSQQQPFSRVLHPFGVRSYFLFNCSRRIFIYSISFSFSQLQEVLVCPFAPELNIGIYLFSDRYRSEHTRRCCVAAWNRNQSTIRNRCDGKSIKMIVIAWCVRRVRQVWNGAGCVNRANCWTIRWLGIAWIASASVSLHPFTRIQYIGATQKRR